MKKASLNGGKISYQIFGTGKVNLVIEIGLGATAGEWWHVAEHLAEKNTVLLYERNRSTTVERTPQTIANELYELLKILSCEEKVMMLAHSQGGLYAQQFARLHPQMVKGILLLDPLSANDNRYKEMLTPKEQKQSGFDKTDNLVIMKHLAALHMGFVIRAIMKKAPPFYYYHQFSKETEDYILTAITAPSLYVSALEEYRLSHRDEYTRFLKEKTDFPDIPLMLITHTCEFAIQETMEFGRTSLELATKIEGIWRSLMKEYLSFSNVHQFTKAKHSGHFIHLTEPSLIDDGILWIEEKTMPDEPDCCPADFCMAVGVICCYVTVVSGIAMYAAIIHGVVNVIGEVPVFLSLTRENGLLGPNPTGLIGMAGMILCAATLFVKLGRTENLLSVDTEK